jgi:hypothetical protein
VTLWQAMRLAGLPTAELARWGRIFSLGAEGAGAATTSA